MVYSTNIKTIRLCFILYWRIYMETQHPNENLKLIKFWAEWCLPCKVMAPIVDQVLDDEKFDNVEFISINIDEQPDAAREYSIRSIPTLLLVNNGDNRVLKTLVGSASAEQVKEFLSNS